MCVSCVLGGEQVDVSDVTQIWGQLLRFNGSMGRDKQREALEQETWKLSAVGAKREPCGSAQGPGEGLSQPRGAAGADL